MAPVVTVPTPTVIAVVPIATTTVTKPTAAQVSAVAEALMPVAEQLIGAVPVLVIAAVPEQRQQVVDVVEQEAMEAAKKGKR